MTGGEHRRAQATKETHYDQTLGCFAQLGLPLTVPVHVDGRTFALRDLLRDSIACFELRESEIEWTAIAYASYLPPHRLWENKFRERYTFDQLADEVLKRDLWKASCCACHIVEAVLTLLRVDREVAPILSPDTRQRLDKRLDQFLAAALARQEADGSWRAHWYRDLVPSGTAKAERGDGARIESRLLATSHLAHLLMYWPKRSGSTHDALRKAESWIHQVLRDAKPEFIVRHYCPASHGAWVLRVASSAVAEGFPAVRVQSGRQSKADSSGVSERGNTRVSLSPSGE